MKKMFLYMVLFLILGSAGGFFVNSGLGWYAVLSRPAFTPPAFVFGPVWTVLYLMLGALYWRIRDNKLFRNLFIVQFILNLLWTPVFFGLHCISCALAVMVALDLINGYLFLRFWTEDKKSSLLLAPYFLWLLFATLLNLYVYILN
jgi:tryptophan-rich sensory protein